VVVTKGIIKQDRNQGEESWGGKSRIRRVEKEKKEVHEQSSFSKRNNARKSNQTAITTPKKNLETENSWNNKKRLKKRKEEESKTFKKNVEVLWIKR